MMVMDVARLVPGSKVYVEGREVKDFSALDVDVMSVTSNSREVGAGALFAALPGAHVHGAVFATSACEAGAVAVVTDEVGRELIGTTISVPVLVVENVSRKLGSIAAQVYGNPASRVRTYAITGTNGKTTTAFMLESLLAGAGHTTGLIGTVEVRIAGERVPAALTTPMPADLQRMFADLVDRGGDALVMEVSSHALAQGRTDPVCFDVAGFTNLTQDHLDYHSTLEEYFEAKASLFTRAKARKAVILLDDEWGRRLYDEASEQIEVWGLALRSQLPEGVRGWQARAEGHDLTLRSEASEEVTCRVALPGEFNLANGALALAMALVGGVSPEELPSELAPVVPGRMEQISDAPRVIVDFAHNTDALVKAMEALRPSTRGRLIVLSGAAGERDAGKRPAMGRALAEHADIVIITDDDPHGEDPAVIREALIAGTRGCDTTVMEIPDRGEAIRHSIEMARRDDTILLAGRGHETIQDMGGRLVELDDRVAAREALGHTEGMNA